jgi:hypothetical protein
MKGMEAVCNEDQVREKISSVRHEISERLSSRISSEVFREAEIIQNKHDILAREELTKPFTI